MAAMPRPLLTGMASTAIAACRLARCCLAPCYLAPCYLTLCGLTLCGLVFAGGAAADAGGARQLGGTSPVSVAITSMSPGYAQPGQTVTVSGTLTNTSSNALSGLSIQLNSSSTPFGYRGQLQQYADGDLSDDSPVSGAVTNLNQAVAPHATVSWSVPLNPADVPITSTFGVYPLAAEAYSGFAELAVSRTFLPFWPGNKAQDPTAQQIAWVWPLIDQPRQGVCPGLLNNGLQASVASGGRLSGLLEAGSQYASSAHLTWAIDPALLASVTTMTQPYQVDRKGCQGTAYPASQAASAWLAKLKLATAGQPVFVTPYDDADIAALTGSNMNADLTRAFMQGRAEAAKVLGRSFSPAAGGSGPTLNGMAWPADGVANYAVLENLAASDQINTVVLDSQTMQPSPPQTYTPSAQTVTPDGEGPDLNVLLSDHTITQVLSGASSGPVSKGTAFSIAQRYLAETAMITAERPNLARSIVIAPPRSWDPSESLASQLLDETVSAPWLRPASLTQLASAKNPTGQVPRQPPTATSPAELPRTLLVQASQLDQQAALLQSIQVQRDAAYDNDLDNGVMAVESSAWRGGGSALAAGQALAQTAGNYLSAQEGKLTIIGAPRATLGGLSGTVPVSVSNGLDFPVRVGVVAGPSGRVTVRQSHPTVVVPPGQQEIVKLQVAATGVGSTTLRLSLVNQAGAPLPTTQASIIVQATHYGDLVLVVIAAALGVFLLTSAARAFRRGPGGRPGPAAGQPDRNPERSGDGPGLHEGDAGQRGSRGDPAEPDSVMSDGPTPSQGSTQPRDHGRAEVTHDYAWAPGQAERR
jgi:hypothetical protein